MCLVLLGVPPAASFEPLRLACNEWRVRRGPKWSLLDLMRSEPQTQPSHCGSMIFVGLRYTYQRRLRPTGCPGVLHHDGVGRRHGLAHAVGVSPHGNPA